MPQQTYKNHARLDPWFHVFLFAAVVAGIAEAVIRLWKEPGFWGVIHLLYALAALVAVTLIRVYALRVQDRVIRLEERLRMQAVLPDSLRPRINDLTVRQLVALRFAPDSELAGLVEQALTSNLGAQEIKKSIRAWRADTHRV